MSEHEKQQAVFNATRLYPTDGPVTKAVVRDAQDQLDRLNAFQPRTGRRLA